MNTADLHPKRFPIEITVAQLQRLAGALQTVEQQPHDQGHVPADRQLELDRAGEQLLTHVAMLVEDTRDQAPTVVVRDTLPLLRPTAKVLLTACDRCRSAALREALQFQGAEREERRGEALLWDGMMRGLVMAHGIGTPLGGEALGIAPGDLTALGLAADALYHVPGHAPAGAAS